MIGHILMDIGLFAYWWTGIAGDFTARPIAEDGRGPAVSHRVRRLRDLAFSLLLAISKLLGRVQIADTRREE